MNAAFRTALVLTVFLAALTGATYWMGAGARIPPQASVDSLDAADLIPAWAQSMTPIFSGVTGLAALVAAALALAASRASIAPGISRESAASLAVALGIVALGGIAFGAISVIPKRDRRRPVAVATPFPTATPVTHSAPGGFQAWAAPNGAFGLAVPSSWVVRPAQGSQVEFDGTKTTGDWTFGDSLLVSWLAADTADERSYDEGCGSHVCSATLTLVRRRHVQLKLRRDWPTDESPADGVVERDLKALAARIEATVW